jgi:hypothetical protein
VSEHLGLGLEEEHLKRLPVFDVAQHTGMPGYVPQSTCLRALGETNQARLLALEDYLLVYLHIPCG